MNPSKRQRSAYGRWTTAALALVSITAGGRAWGQAPPAPAGNLERAAAMVRTRAFEDAAVVLRRVLSADPANRRANEMLAFALESMGDLEGERRTRAALAARFPDDAGIQEDYGRVLERSGEEAGALRAYRRARERSGERSAPELDAAIARMKGRTALEIGTPLGFLSDPDATATSARAGVAIPVGSRRHVTLLGGRAVAEGRAWPGATTSDELALTFVQRTGGGASWAAGPRLHVISPPGATRRDAAAGGVIEGRAGVGTTIEADARAAVEIPWDEAAVALLRGGRTTEAGGRLYAHGFSRRLLLQAGARRRRLSILAADPRSEDRPRAWQTLRIAGADLVLWRNPGASVRGEMLDETLLAPTTSSAAVTVAYRHYDVSTRTSPEFAAIVGLAPRGSVDEASVAGTVASPRGDLGLDLRAGLARDSARRANTWRAGGSLIWAPTPATRLALGYEGATEVVSGLAGQRRAGWLSFHVDF